MDHIKEVQLSTFRDWSFSKNGSRNYFPCTPLSSHGDLDECIELILYRSDEYFTGGIRLKKVPKHVKQVVIHYKVYLLDSENVKVAIIGGSSGRGFIFDDGRNQGMGPWGMFPNNDYCMGTSVKYEVLNKYVSNGTFKVCFQITKYTPTYDEGTLMLLLVDKLQADGKNSRSEVLEREKEQLLIDQERLTQQLIDLKRIMLTLTETLETQTQKSKKYQEEIVRLTVDNVEYQQETKRLNDEIVNLQEKLDKCKPEEALRKLSPDKIKLDGYDITGKKELLLNLLTLQNIISSEILQGEKCSSCRKEVRRCVVTPCNHLAYCQSCFDQKREESEMTCPICSESVTSGITVQQ